MRATSGNGVVRMAAVDKSKIPLNLYRPKDPYTATCIFNTRIVDEGAPGETMHMAFNHDGKQRSQLSDSLLRLRTENGTEEPFAVALCSG